jgi:hypothetical protein
MSLDVFNVNGFCVFTRTTWVTAVVRIGMALFSDNLLTQHTFLKWKGRDVFCVVSGNGKRLMVKVMIYGITEGRTLCLGAIAQL